MTIKFFFLFYFLLSFSYGYNKKTLNANFIRENHQITKNRTIDDFNNFLCKLPFEVSVFHLSCNENNIEVLNSFAVRYFFAKKNKNIYSFGFHFFGFKNIYFFFSKGLLSFIKIKEIKLFDLVLFTIRLGIDSIGITIPDLVPTHEKGLNILSMAKGVRIIITARFFIFKINIELPVFSSYKTIKSKIVKEEENKQYIKEEVYRIEKTTSNLFLNLGYTIFFFQDKNLNFLKKECVNFYKLTSLFFLFFSYMVNNISYILNILFENKK